MQYDIENAKKAVSDRKGEKMPQGNNEKMLFENNNRFADLLNFFIYEGAQAITPEQLHAVNIAEMYAAVKDDAESFDESLAESLSMNVFDHAVMKSGCGIDFLIYDLTQVDYGMVIKVMAAASIGYSYQALSLEKGKKLRPVLPIAVYRGEEDWDAAVTMKELLGDFPGIEACGVRDASINLVQPRTFTDAQLNLFQSDLKDIFKACQAKNSWV